MALIPPRSLALLLSTLMALTLSLGYHVASAPQAQADAITSFSLTDTNIPLVPTGTPREWNQVAPSGAVSTKLTATFSTGSATYSVDGGASVPLTDATASVPIPLNDGLTTIVVTHVDTATTTYTLYIRKVRLLTGIEVEGGTLTPAFDPLVFTYTVTLPHDDTQTRIRATWDPTPTANATGFTYCIDTGFSGVTQTPGDWSGYGNLGVGNNYRNLLLRTDTPQGVAGGCTSGSPKRYEINIIRESAFSSTKLSALTLEDSNITLSSTNTPYVFNSEADSRAQSTRVKATFSMGSATYSVDGGASVTLTDATASVPIPLNDGLTTIVVTHVHTATTTYTLYIRKVRLLTGIEVEGGTLTPAFDPLIFDYTVTLPHDDTQTRIRATWNSTPTANATGFTYCIDTGFSGVTQTPGEWSGYGDLGVGGNYRNLILLTNTPQGWAGGCRSGTPKRYGINIIRESAFTSGTISALTLEDSSITVSSTATPYVFDAEANSMVTTTKLRATFSTGTASYTVDGGSPIALTTATPSAPIPLNDGLTTIVVTHVHTATTTYTLYIRKVRLLTGIEVEGGTLTPAFDPLLFTYTVTLPHDDTQTRIRATWDPNPTANATGFTYCIDTGFPGVTQTPGDWSGYGNLSVGNNYRNLLLRTDTPQGVAGGCTSGFPKRYEINIIRADAFTSIGGVAVPGVPSLGTPITAGTAITAVPSGVTGIPAPTVTYDWEAADDSTFTAFTVVATTATPTWTPTNEVADAFIRVTATASNGLSVSSSTTSTPFGPIAGVNEAPGMAGITITGTPEAGSTLTATVAGLSGYPRPTATYQWEIADDSQSAFTALPGEVNRTLPVTSAHLSKVLRVTATATNGIGSPATATSIATSAVTAAQSTPAEPPSPAAPAGIPQAVTAQAAGRSVVVTWLPPAVTGDFPISSYQVQAYPGTATCITVQRTCILTGLAPGGTYVFRVRALNGAGWGAYSAASEPVLIRPQPSVGAGSIVVVGSRGIVRSHSGVIVEGTTIGIADGTPISAHVRLPGWRGYRTGSVVHRVRIVEDDRGVFSWSRRTAKTVRVYFTAETGERSRVVVIPGKTRK